MAGRGPAPKSTRRNKADVPVRGEWKATPGVGWQHRPFPEPPDGLSDASRLVWVVWFQAWFASHWEPSDLPGLAMTIRLYDLCLSSDASGAQRSELRLMMDNYGITPKGRQDRRWTEPKADDQAKPAAPAGSDEQVVSARYAHLRAV